MSPPEPPTPEPCGDTRHGDGAKPCVLPSGHRGMHTDENGDSFGVFYRLAGRVDPAIARAEGREVVR